MSNASFDVLTVVGDFLLQFEDQRTAKALCNVSPDLFCYMYHKIYSSIQLYDEGRCSRLLKLNERRLVCPTKVTSLQASLTDDSTALRSALKLFIQSSSLELLELHGPKDGAACHHDQDLLSLALQITSTAIKPLTVIFISVALIPHAFFYHSYQLELRHSSLAPVTPNNNAERLSPLKAISCTTDVGDSLFEAMFILQVELPDLTHLLLHFNPGVDDLDIVDDTLTTVLDYSNKLQEIMIVFEPNNSPSASYLSCVDKLEQVLTHVASRHYRPLALRLQFNCDVAHAFEVLHGMGSLAGFATISASVQGNEALTRALLKYVYLRFITSGANRSLRVERTLVDRPARVLMVFGFIVQDDVTTSALPRGESHYDVCPWARRPELRQYEEQYQDTLVPANTL